MDETSEQEEDETDPDNLEFPETPRKPKNQEEALAQFRETKHKADQLKAEDGRVEASKEPVSRSESLLQEAENLQAQMMSILGRSKVVSGQSITSRDHETESEGKQDEEEKTMTARSEQLPQLQVGELWSEVESDQETEVEREPRTQAEPALFVKLALSLDQLATKCEIAQQEDQNLDSIEEGGTVTLASPPELLLEFLEDATGDEILEL
ncbi:hypothetical protein R1sor_023126 [Riccia sorocarpa]|uniref:Uncharacterized protein n=1 Tax=Riccia sorocarpa TaxID=122646 RepID=A0ABD3GQ41_9MARC